MININYKKLSELAKTPFRKFDADAGFDFYCTWKDDSTTSKYIEYGTDIALEIPVGYVGLLFPRSSVTNMDLILKNCVGVIDATYRGEIKFRFYNLEGNNTYDIGDRVGQIIFIERPDVNLNEVEELSDTKRGTGGYGHTGKK